jgi:hypothetical protein
MTCITSNLSTKEQQVAAVVAKRKEDDTVTMSHAVVAAVCKTLDETRAHERAATLAWEKEKTNARHPEQQLAATQEIVIL